MTAIREQALERTERLSRAESILQLMLLAHGLMLAAVGAVIAFWPAHTTGRSFVVVAQLPGWPWSWGVAAMAAGAALVVARQRRHFKACRITLNLMTVWSISYGVGLTAGAYLNGGLPYAVFLYAGLGALYQMHRLVLVDDRVR